MESEAMRLVCDFLLKEGTTWDALSKSEKKLFEKVVPVIQQRLEGLEQAEAMRRENAINQSSISTAIGVARKTVCTNNPLVAKFISVHSSVDQKSDIKAERYAHLQAELAETKVRLDKVLDQEIIAQDYAVKLHLEQERVAQKEIQIHNLEEENAQLRAELDKYRKAEIKGAIRDENFKTIAQFAGVSKNKN